MGAWGHRVFENDDALDFVADLHESGDASKIPAAINTIIEFKEAEDGYGPESTEASYALAAIEYVAAAKGKQSVDFPEDSEDWLKENSPLETDNIISPGKEAIQKIRTSSELKDLWEETEDYQNWLAVL